MAYITLTELRTYLDVTGADTCTGSAANDTLTCATVRFVESLHTATEVTVSNSGGALPAPLAANTVYYVILVADQVIKLATTSALATAGTAFNLTTDGTGTQTITRSLADNDLLTDCIEAAQEYIESATNRQFEAAEAIRYYGRDALSHDDHRLLLLDADLVIDNTVTNGDAKTATTYTPAFATDTLTLASAAVWSALSTASRVTVTSTTHDPPDPLVERTVYYAILGASPVIQLATTAALAVAGTQITLTDDGTGTHTITPEGQAIPNTEYWLHPRNVGPPYYGIRLKTNSAYTWTIDTDCSISVNGDWGYSATVPEDVKQACLVLAAYFYRQKDSQVFDTTAFPEAGVITIPSGIPSTVTKVLLRYKRYL